MKRILIALAVVAAGIVVVLHPVPRPTAAATGWSGTPSSEIATPGGGPHSGGRLGTQTPPSRVVVYVAGEVAKPGLYHLRAQDRVADAVTLAGGARPSADLVAINLAAHIADGDEIVVPTKGAAQPAAARRRHASAQAADGTDAVSTSHRSHGPRRARRHKERHDDGLPPAGVVDINTADAQTLASIPGIGAGLSERIVAFRTANGPFTSVDELLDVSGITDRRLEALLPYVVAR